MKPEVLLLGELLHEQGMCMASAETRRGDAFWSRLCPPTLPLHCLIRRLVVVVVAAAVVGLLPANGLCMWSFACELHHLRQMISATTRVQEPWAHWLQGSALA